MGMIVVNIDNDLALALGRFCSENGVNISEITNPYPEAMAKVQLFVEFLKSKGDEQVNKKEIIIEIGSLVTEVKHTVKSGQILTNIVNDILKDYNLTIDDIGAADPSMN